MSNHESQAFAQRLAEIIEGADAQELHSPTILAKAFNRHPDRRNLQPISIETARSWLRGKAIPEQKNLVTLAKLVNVHPSIVRYGKEESE